MYRNSPIKEEEQVPTDLPDISRIPISAGIAPPDHRDDYPITSRGANKVAFMHSVVKALLSGVEGLLSMVDACVVCLCRKINVPDQQPTIMRGVLFDADGGRMYCGHFLRLVKL